MFLVLLSQPKIIIANHIDSAVGRAIIMWAVGVKVKGNSAKKFIKNRDMNIVSVIFLIPFWLLGSIRFSSSFFKGINIDLIKIIDFLFIFFLNDNDKIRGVIMAIHVKDKYLIEGSKIENKLFIIFRKCFLILNLFC